MLAGLCPLRACVNVIPWISGCSKPSAPFDVSSTSQPPHGDGAGGAGSGTIDRE
jgi:hypothetical protein